MGLNKSKCLYHIVLTTKYREKIFCFDFVQKLVKRCLNKLLVKWNSLNIVDYSIELDHIHLLLKVKPSYNISRIVGDFKQLIGFELFNTYPYIKRNYFKNTKSLWTRSYYCTTVGDISSKVVINYIKSQENYQRIKL